MIGPMRLLSAQARQAPRTATSGYVLMDVLVSMAIMSLFLVTVFSAFGRTTLRADQAIREYYMTEVAQSVLAEAEVRFPDYEVSGHVGERWFWEIQRQDRSHLSANIYESLWQPVELIVEVREVSQPDLAVSLSMVVLALRE